jgi:hypothetical protein
MWVFVFHILILKPVEDRKCEWHCLPVPWRKKKKNNIITEDCEHV